MGADSEAHAAPRALCLYLFSRCLFRGVEYGQHLGEVATNGAGALHRCIFSSSGFSRSWPGLVFQWRSFGSVVLNNAKQHSLPKEYTSE